MKTIATLSSLEQFLFEVPLYVSYNVRHTNVTDDKVLKGLYGRTGKTNRVDGYCPFCHRASTFTVTGKSIPNGIPWENIAERNAYDDLYITCVRSEYHIIRYWFGIKKLEIEKVGQFPSLASVANDAVSQYRKNMDTEDSNEFHKAIGLAAHGVGVGSFVYLRRVFERLIYKRFEDQKDLEGWSDNQFYNLRMEEKINFLKDKLPIFLVENRKVYSILSIGIHELKEETCLSYFEAIKQGIIMILEDDKLIREQIERRKIFSHAIANFKVPE